MKTLIRHLPTLLLTCALLAGFLFRFYQLGQTPLGLYVDEASLGYNAYSIYKTGMDEYGKALPVMFRSFATFQSPVYSYLLIPFIHFLDLSVFSVRLPSAIFGFLSIPLLYLLVKELSPAKYASNLAAVSALFLAISPWHIAYSRTAYETNISLFFLLLGCLFFFYSLKRPWLFLLSAMTLSVSMMAYRAEMLIVPVLVFALTCRYFRAVISQSKKFLLYFLSAGLVAFIILWPTIRILNTPGFQARSAALNIFATNLQLPWGYRVGDGPLHRLSDNPRLLATREFLSLYSAYLSPRYLFSLGDSGPRLPYPGLGTFFVWQFPLYLLGLYYLIKEKPLKNLTFFVLILLLASPIPAALTRDPYSTLRALAVVVPQTIIVAFGLLKLLESLSWRFTKLKYLLVVFLVLYSTTRMFISIFYFNDYFNSKFWNYGWHEAVETIQKLDTALPILVDSSHGDSYILLLFFLKYDPATYQQDNFEVAPNDYYTDLRRSEIKYLGRTTVKSLVWGPDTDEVEQYLVADFLAMSEVQIKAHHLSIIKEIYYPDGKVALRILKTNPKTK